MSYTATSNPGMIAWILVSPFLLSLIFVAYSPLRPVSRALRLSIYCSPLKLALGQSPFFGPQLRGHPHSLAGNPLFVPKLHLL